MRVGYVRCSTEEQNPQRQKHILKDAGCEKIFMGMLSGKDRNRPQLKTMLEFIREGDVVYVESISRLARSTKDLLEIVDEIKNKGAFFVSQKENIDTDTPQGKFMLTVFAAMADLERSQILQRQAEGIAIAKANGVYRGRIPKPVDRIQFEQLYKQRKDGDIKQTYMMKKLGVSRASLYRLIKNYESGLVASKKR